MPSSPPPTASNQRAAVAIFRAPLFNSSETFIRNQAAALVRHRPVFVGLEAKADATPDEAVPMVLPSNRAERAAFSLLGRVGAIAERLRSHAPVLIHAHFGPDGLAALPLARALGVPLVTTLHGYDVGRSRRAMLLSGRLSWTRYALARDRLMRGGALFLAVSEAVRRRAVAQGFPADRTFVHRVGVDLGRFRPDPDKAEPGLILHVGRLVEKKGTAVLIEAFARLRREGRDTRLVVIGDGPERAALERSAVVPELAGRVDFLGEISPDEVAAWLRRAWLIAAPSVTARDGDAEGLPTVLVEAAASGVPAVATDHMGNAEAVIDGRSGLLVGERDPAALAAALARLLASAALRAEFAKAARSHAERAFDLARQTEVLERHYDRVAGLG